MHLTQIPEFLQAPHAEWRLRLHQLNIRHLEQLGTLLAAPEGRYALQKLGVPLQAVQEVVEPRLRDQLKLSLSKPFGSGLSKVSLLSRETHPMGYNMGDNNPFLEAAFDAPLPAPPPLHGPQLNPASGLVGPELPAQHSLAAIKAPDQGRRGTCVAFCVTGMYSLMRQKAGLEPVTLSPQHLYWRTKFEDASDLDEDGTSINAALEVLKDGGACLEKDLEYIPRHDFAQTYLVKGHNPKKTEHELKSLARMHRIRGYQTLGRTVQDVKALLAQNIPVGVGVALFQLAWYNAQARSRGEISLPLMDLSGEKPVLLDTYIGAHAILLTGYCDNSVEEDEKSHRPGGGYFIFRNSWGEDWAKQNDKGRGYGYLPYEYFTKFCLEAASIEALAENHTPPAKASGKRNRPRSAKKKNPDNA